MVNKPQGVTGLGIKLKNKRVGLARYDGGWLLRFKRLGEDKKVIDTKLSLSDEAMSALVLLYSRICKH